MKKEKIKIKDWINWKDAEKYKSINFNIYGSKYFNTLKESILENKIKKSGTWHQHDDFGVPLFSDGKVLLLSMRSWGDLMANIWSEQDNKKYDYIDFAWYTPDEPLKISKKSMQNFLKLRGIKKNVKSNS